MRSRRAIASIPMAMPACCSARKPDIDRHAICQSSRSTDARTPSSSACSPPTAPRAAARSSRRMAWWRRRPSCRSAPRRRVKGMLPEAVRASRRRHRARQHLSPDAAARAPSASRRSAACTQFMNWPHADPDRFRRLPGDVAVRPAQGRGTGRDLPLASRRRHGRALARARDRDPGAARLRHRHAARRMHRAAGAARRARARHAAVAALGRALQARLRRRRRPARALFGIVQGGDDPALRLESARALVDIGLSRLCDRRACGRRAAGGDAADDRRGRAGAAGRPAALSDGRRHARRICSRRWRAASTCSTACCRPATAGTGSPSRASGRST